MLHNLSPTTLYKVFCPKKTNAFNYPDFFESSVMQKAKKNSVSSAVLWGLLRHCPQCRRGKLFQGYLRPVDICEYCHESFHGIRADDFPPYVTIFLVGHIVISLILFTEKNYALNYWTQIIIWPLFTLALTLIFMPFVKGAILGLMWALGLAEKNADTTEN